MNNAKLLPDAYRKDTDSNIYKLFQLINLTYSEAESDLKNIELRRNLESASGTVLDLIAESYGVARNGESDDNVRTRILFKIVKNNTSVDCNSIIEAINTLLNQVPEYVSWYMSDFIKPLISIKEGECSICVLGMTLDMVKKSGLSKKEITKLVSELIPIGVKLEEPYYSGTLYMFETGRWSWLMQDYPVLYSAWRYGQAAKAQGEEVGLQGHCEVPEDFKKYNGTHSYTTEGDFSGGTLGELSGE